ALALTNPRPLREINPAIPPSFADLIMRLLAKKPEQRPPSAHAVAEAIEAIERNLAASGTTTGAQPLPQSINIESRPSPALGVEKSPALLNSQGLTRHAARRGSGRRRSSLTKGTIALAVVLLLA